MIQLFFSLFSITFLNSQDVQLSFVWLILQIIPFMVFTNIDKKISLFEHHLFESWFSYICQSHLPNLYHFYANLIYQNPYLPSYHIFGFDLVANCGDSRCVLSRNGQEVDLRFEKEKERERKELKLVDFLFLFLIVNSWDHSPEVPLEVR